MEQTRLSVKDLAEQLYFVAAKAQWCRMSPKQNPNDFQLSFVSCKFDDLFNEAKGHYLAQAEWVLNNKHLL